MKSIFCPHCGKLLEQGDIFQFQPCIEINETLLDYGNELQIDWRENYVGDELPTYECTHCNTVLADYTGEDIVQIYKRITSFEESVKLGVEFKTHSKDLTEEFNKYIKYTQSEQS